MSTVYNDKLEKQMSVYYTKQEKAAKTWRRRKILLFVLAIIGFIAVALLFWGQWSSMINSKYISSSLGIQIGLSAQYTWLSTPIWEIQWSQTGEFLATVFYSSRFNTNNANPSIQVGSNAPNGGNFTQFDVWVGSVNDQAVPCTQAASNCRDVSLISVIKSNYDSAENIEAMIDAAVKLEVMVKPVSVSPIPKSIINDIFMYGLPILNTVMMGASILVKG